MYFFRSDYSSGAHPDVLAAIAAANSEQWDGYGQDAHSENARRLIQERIKCPDSDIWFLTGGTITNLAAIATFLRPHESVIAARTSHIYVHETGAIEAAGHRVSVWKTDDGKLKPDHIEEAVREHEDAHSVSPKLVYISDTTEVGTVYTKAELIALRQSCDRHGLYLYIDGARLGSALTSPGADLSLEEIAALADAFYIGGTKNGLLFGEALVIKNDELKSGFDHIMKQRGGLLAKGFLLGVQFEALFKDDLYFKLAARANELAAKLRTGISDLGYTFETNAASNQLFPIFKRSLIEKLEADFFFSRQTKINDEYESIRLVTSWDTKESAVEALIDCLK